MIWWWFYAGNYAEHFWFGSDRELPRPAPEPDATVVISLANERAKRRRAAMRAL